MGFFEREGIEGFLDSLFLRFGRQEDGYLSNAVDGPVVWVNVNDWAGPLEAGGKNPGVQVREEGFRLTRVGGS